jgi:hypothetical protein
MSPERRGVSAKKVARDFGLDITSFIDEVMSLISELGSDQASASMAERRRESCAVLWATILLSLDASALGADEAQALRSSLFACLESAWRKHWSAIDEDQLQIRAQKYLNHKDARSQVRTASRIVACFFETIEITQQGQRRLGKRLAALLGHRMLSDVHRLNQVKMNFRIQLSLATALLSSVCLCGGTAALRLLRIL